MIGKFVPPVEFADDVQIKHSKTASMLNPRMFRRPIFFRYSSSTRSPPAGADRARAIFPVPAGWAGGRHRNANPNAAGSDDRRQDARSDFPRAIARRGGMCGVAAAQRRFRLQYQ